MHSIQANFFPENNFWLRDVPKEDFYLYFEIEGAQPPASQKRVPLNIALVIDRSGSMNGDKIDYAKKALEFVVKNLGFEDVLALVQYDDVVEVLNPSSKLDDKEGLMRKINLITARNMTNLSGGMLEGYNQVDSSKKEGVVNRVLLLSDGLANVGITEPGALRKIAQEKFRNEGIALSTFGVGADFDELLMTSMSEYGGGNYYFIDSPDKIPAIFAKELNGLLAVVAQGSTLDIHFPEGFTCEQVFGYLSEPLPQGVRVRFNDVFALEKKAILVKMRAGKTPQSDITFHSNFTYFDAISSDGQVQQQQEICVQLVSDAKQLTQGVVSKVAEQKALFTATELMDQASRYTEVGNSKGIELLNQAIALIELQLINTPDSLVLQKLLQTIRNLVVQHQDYHTMNFEEKSTTLKITRSALYNYKRQIKE